MEACSFEFKVLTLPSNISLNFVKFDISLHLKPREIILFAVAPVEIIPILNLLNTWHIF